MTTTSTTLTPGSVAGASIPGFDALFIGRAQLFISGDTKVIGANTVNEFHIGYLRNANIIGQPKGGLGFSLASQGFAPGRTTEASSFRHRNSKASKTLPSPPSLWAYPSPNLTQINNTFYVS